MVSLRSACRFKVIHGNLSSISRMTPRDADWYHYLPDEVKEILSRLDAAGFTTYVVGGAVRDLLLGETPKDFDLVSNAKPGDISGLFEKTLEIGKQFGISMVVQNGKQIEIAAFRKESTYTDSRHPDKIEYATPEEDAKRRDFTINGLFWDPKNKKIIDYVEGIKDLEQKKIRCIGDANERFKEDALRMLRALRFYSLLRPFGFTLESSVVEAVKANKERIKKVSRERITQELDWTFTTRDPAAGLLIGMQTGLWTEIFPGVDLLSSALPHLDQLLKADGTSLWVGLAFCVSDPEAMLKNLTLPQSAKELIRYALKMRGKTSALLKADLAEQKTAMNSEYFPMAVKTISIFDSDKSAEKLMALRGEFERHGTLNPAPLLTGDDLKKLGFQPGKPMGLALQAIRKAQLNEIISTKEAAIAYLEKNKP